MISNNAIQSPTDIGGLKIIPRGSPFDHRYANVCLYLDGVEKICTDDTGFGAPLIEGPNIVFRANGTVTSAELVWPVQTGDYADNWAQIVSLFILRKLYLPKHRVFNLKFFFQGRYADLPTLIRV